MGRDFDLNFDSTKNSAQQSPPKIWCFASGKGGVGKSFVSSGMALSLAKLGKTVIAVDLDLTGANLHTSFGFGPTPISLRQYFEGTKKLDAVTLPTKYSNLKYIQGFWDSWSPTELTEIQIENLFQDLKKFNADYILLDLGPGGTQHYINIMNRSDEKFLISTPDVSSIEKTYRFIESYLCYSLKDSATKESYSELISALQESRFKSDSSGFFSFRDHLKKAENIQLSPFTSIDKNPIKLIINNTRNHAQHDLGFSMRSVCKKYYDLRLDYIGSVDHDGAALQIQKNKDHILDLHPFSPIVGQFLSTCKQLIDPEELRAVS